MNVIEDKLEQYGYATIESLYPPNEIDRIASEYYQLLDRLGETFVFGMLNQGGSSWKFAAEPETLKIARYFLGDDIRIGAVACKWLKPGAKQLRIHPDATEPLKVIPNFPFLINTMTTFTDFTVENGAFRVIPFTHKSPMLKADVLNLFNHTEIENEDIKSVPVCVPKGSVILWDSRLWHGHGPNVSDDLQRLNLNISYYPSWWNIRIEQNHQPVWPEMFNIMPQALKDLVAWKVGKTRNDVYETP